jgi:hypothetical protein
VTTVPAPIVVSAELRLAHRFLGTLDDMRAPWSAAFDAWADERGLAPELARSTKVTVLRLRMLDEFG